MIEKYWKSYRDKCVHPAASDVQVAEVRKAFYAGAGTLFYGIICRLSPGDEAMAPDMEMLSEVERDLAKEMVPRGTVN